MADNSLPADETTPPETSSVAAVELSSVNAEESTPRPTSPAMGMSFFRAWPEDVFAPKEIPLSREERET